MLIYPLFDALVVTPNDTQDLVRPAVGKLAQDNTNPNFIGVGALIAGLKNDMNLAIAVSVAVAGNLVYDDNMGNTQTVALGVNCQYFFRIKRIRATLTTATGIVAYFPVFQ